MEPLVEIIVCGVQKGGTTSLYAHFQDHPQLQSPIRKEIHFFDDESQDWTRPNYANLHRWFEEVEHSRRRFDITPIYCFWPRAIERLKAYNPDAKLIFLFRDPIERAWSQWKMSYSLNAEPMTFARAIREGRTRIDLFNPLAQQNRDYTYVERGFYGSQVHLAQQNFPADQLLFLRSQDLMENHANALKLISDFLGIDKFPETGPKREHQAASVAYPSDLTLEDQLYLSHIFGPELAKFKQFTNIDTSEWLTDRLIQQKLDVPPFSFSGLNESFPAA